MPGVIFNVDEGEEEPKSGVYDREAVKGQFPGAFDLTNKWGPAI